MFVRCERCRAVYDFQPPSGESVSLRCARCGHAFPAPDADVQLRPLGTLGGAAALAYEPERWREVSARASAPLKPTAPPPSRPQSRSTDRAPAATSNRRGLVAGLVAGVLIVGAAIPFALHKGRGTSQALPAAAAAKVDSAKKLLELDDLASLEAAVATFADASTLAPEHPAPKAWRAVATTLLGASLKVEAAELTTELQAADRHAKRLQRQQPPADPAEIEQFTMRASDLRQRIGPATQRGDKLLHEGAELVRALAAPDAEDTDVLRAKVIVAAAAQDVDRIALLTKDLEPSALDAWIAYGRGLSRVLGNVSQQKAQEARTWLEAALQKDPSLARAKWDLARLALVSRPPDYDRATSLYAELTAASPAHEGAKRGAESMELMKLAAADQQADAQASDGQ